MDPSKAEPTLAAVFSDCVETTQLARPGASPLESVIRRYRAADGRLRVDYGKISVITDPATGERIVLDHVAREARILTQHARDLVPDVRIPAEPQLPNIPRPPAIPNYPHAPDVVALGKDVINGLEVEGTRYVYKILDPLSPPPITSWEVWTSTKLQVPVLTRTTGNFGVRTTVCNHTAVEPPVSTFEVPSGYKVIRQTVPRPVL